MASLPLIIQQLLESDNPLYPNHAPLDRCPGWGNSRGANLLQEGDRVVHLLLDARVGDQRDFSRLFPFQ